MQVLLGMDSVALLAFAAGAKATVLGSPNATPRSCVRLFELAVEQEDLAEARALWRTLFPVFRFFENEGYVPSVKAATQLRGLPVGAPRRPGMPLSDAKRAELAALLEGLAAAPAKDW